jgi:hypothetical protein
MPLIAYRKYNPRKDAKLVIDRANEILEISRQDGFGVMTLRQIYYQFIAKNWLPENTVQQYKKLGRILSDAREGGLVDWLSIDDAGRSAYHFRDCKTVNELLDGVERGLLINPWEDQAVYSETWVEKKGMEGTIARPCNAKRAGYMACMRFAEQKAKGKRLVLFHLGDHDPSGIDMTRDNKDRLEFFAREHGIEVQRLALNMDQVEQYDPPPQFAKQTDSRFEGYEAQFGTESWELDALRQSVIGKLITDALDSIIDKDKWALSMEREQELRRSTRVAELASRWDEVHKLLWDDGLPMDRLRAYEANMGTYPAAIATALDGACKVVNQHDGENNRHLLQDMVDDRDNCHAAQRALDAIWVNAESMAAERAERREKWYKAAPELDDETATDEDDDFYADDDE